MLLAAHDDLVQTADELAHATDAQQRKMLADRYDRLNEMLRQYDAYNVDHRVEEVLDGLGFRKADYDRPVETFSGGQQSRVMLAKLLLAAPDVMLLDEPSNHLDIAATRWLEDYLARQPEAMLIVSHDRYFLDKVVTKVFEMNGGDIDSYPGNFQAYWRLRRERYEQQLKTWQAQREYIEKQEEYIRRVHYGQLHKQAQSRQKALDKLERVERPTWIDTPHMHFGPVRRTGDIVLRAERHQQALRSAAVREAVVHARARQAARHHGAQRLRQDDAAAQSCSAKRSRTRGRSSAAISSSSATTTSTLRSLDGSKSVMRAVWPHDDADAGEQAMRNLLGRFGLTGDQVHQTVDQLSGGERSRAALARLVADGVNVLVLDEPTNHLDLWACDALEQALGDYEGTAIVVSHDRYFLNRVVADADRVRGRRAGADHPRQLRHL